MRNDELDRVRAQISRFAKNVKKLDAKLALVEKEK